MKRKNICSFSTLVFCAFLFGEVVARVSAQQAGQVSSSAPADANYRINPNDALDFRVYDESDMDRVIRVAGDGTANLPLIGTVKIGGCTMAEATQVITARYRKGYLVNPQINLTVREYAKRYFTLLGEVNRSGAYDMNGQSEIPLLQAIGMASGYSKTANPSKISVKRVVNGNEVVIKVDAKRMAKGDQSAAFQVLPGDIITVGEALF